jgi:hypothetical protein
LEGDQGKMLLQMAAEGGVKVRFLSIDADYDLALKRPASTVRFRPWPDPSQSVEQSE